MGFRKRKNQLALLTSSTLRLAAARAGCVALGLPWGSMSSHSPAGNRAHALPAQTSPRLATELCEKCGLERRLPLLLRLPADDRCPGMTRQAVASLRITDRPLPGRFPAKARLPAGVIDHARRDPLGKFVPQFHDPAVDLLAVRGGGYPERHRFRLGPPVTDHGNDMPIEPVTGCGPRGHPPPWACQLAIPRRSGRRVPVKRKFFLR